MTTLSEERIAELVAPYLVVPVGVSMRFPVPEGLYRGLAAYLELLLRWNARTNLTAVRDPAEIVTRHFGESLFAGVCLAVVASEAAAVLDFGSGGGFPGLPIQLLLPRTRVMLAESQGKKAAFLREAVRALGVEAEVWAGRVEALPVGQSFDVVTMRAVDKMEEMGPAARGRVRPGGVLLELVAGAVEGEGVWKVPGSEYRFVRAVRCE